MIRSSKRSGNILSSESAKLRDIITRIKNVEADLTRILAEYELLPKKPEVPSEDSRRIIEHLFSRFDQVARQLIKRYNDRDTLKIKDEYDVQDLLHSLLKIFFDDIRREEYAPSYAGVSPRFDLLIKDEKIVIECKFLKKGKSPRRIRDELIIDKTHYRTHPDCRLLYCFVYDPDKIITNPRGFERDLSDVVNGFETKVFVIQG